MVASLQVYKYFLDPQLSSQWKVVMPDILGLGSQAVSLWAESCELPIIKSISPDDYQHKGTTFHIAGQVSSDNATIVFYLDQTNFIERYFTAWNKLIVNDNGTRNYKAEYEKEITVYRLSNPNIPVTTYTLKGCFPLGGVTYSLNSARGERLTYSQQFSVDSIAVRYLADFNKNGI